MYNNQFSDESLGAQPTEAYPPMEELQPRPGQQPPAHTPPPGESTAHPVPSEEVEEVEARQEEALTIKYAIGKLNDYLGWFLIVLETTLVIRFMGIVGSPSFHQNQFFEFPTLIAIGIYYLIFWALRRFLRILISSPE